MDRPIPLWFFLFCMLIGALFTLAFGWTVSTTLAGANRAGAVGSMAVEVARFPSKVKTVIMELLSYRTGDHRDRWISVAREPNADYSGFEPIPSVPGIEVPGLLMRADRAAVTRGWRLLVGVFAIDGTVENAALLMSPDLQVVRKWVLDEMPVGGLEPEPTHRRLVHGLEVLEDGSLIFTSDNAISLQRFDACGERLWSAAGLFHHAVTLDDERQTVWTFLGGPRVEGMPQEQAIVQVGVEDGTILRRIPMDAIIERNPMIDILEIRRAHDNGLGDNARNTKGKWLDDHYHLNDVDPLPAGLADRFERFDAGDLLVSARNLNLVFVLDPDTLEVKWWRVGAVQRQHDPDWLPNGEIGILNNRMSRDFSEIVSIDPDSFERTTILDGREIDFYTRVRGKHQPLGNDGLVVTSPQQGRAFELSREGDIVFEIANQKPESDTTNYIVSEMRWLPPSMFDLGEWECR